MTVSSIDEMEAALTSIDAKSAKLAFGPSASLLRHGQWFASLTVDGIDKQCRGNTLRDALNAVLGFQDEVEVITIAPKPASVSKVAEVSPAPSTDLMDLLG